MNKQILVGFMLMWMVVVAIAGVFTTGYNFWVARDYQKYKTSNDANLVVLARNYNDMVKQLADINQQLTGLKEKKK